MKPAVNVVYRDIESSAALNAIITKKIEKLSRYSDHILGSRVVIDIPHNHKHKGKMFRASLELDLKGAPLTVHSDDESIHVAVRDAFNSAERKLKQTVSRKRNGRNGEAPAIIDEGVEVDDNAFFDDYDVNRVEH